MSTTILKIERLAYGGVSIGRHNGKVVMVKGAVLPGETVEADIDNEKSDYITASAKKVIEPSPERIEPACKYFGLCGGCNYQHIPYALQVQLKEEILKDCLKRLAKTEIELSAPVVNDNPWNYRLRGKFKVSRDKIGFYKENTREVIDIDSCPLMVSAVNDYFGKSRSLIGGLGVREIHITGEENPMVLIHVPAHTKINKRNCGQFAMKFLNSGFSGFCIEAGNRIVFRYGTSYSTLNLGGLKYTVSPSGFFQSHWKLNLSLIDIIKNKLQPLKDKKILDLYAGAGNFSLPLAKDARVIAVEENRAAVKDGSRNLKINKIRNCKFIRSSSENFQAKDNVDIVILDPPRPGLTKKAMSNVLSLLPERIVYISCNPTTFARDLKKLLSKYEVESLRMADFFPQTYHIEVLAFLRKTV
jgi:23S rRNA (uracil1939-C5)-methyltransferase